MSIESQTMSDEYEVYLRDESRRTGRAERIMFATSEADVCEALAGDGAVTIQGARTGIVGGAVPEGGTILNLSQMNAISEVRDGLVTVQPGALLTEVAETVGGHGLFFPPDPTETSASIGGMLAANASGAGSFFYGATRRWVDAIRVVLADGDVLRLDRSAKARGGHFSLLTEGGQQIKGCLPALQIPDVKSAAGYWIDPEMEMIDLFIGMEGTLGVITEVTLRLLPVPKQQTALCAFFPDEARALQFVRFLRGESGNLAIRPVAIEFFDHGALSMLRRARSERGAFASLPALADHLHSAVYFEFHGPGDADIEEAVVCSAEQMLALGASDEDCWMADGPREIEKHKLFRHATPELVNLLIDERKKAHPELTKLGTDMSVPDDALERVIQMYRHDLDREGLEYVIFGHVGNNHLHVNVIPRTVDELSCGKALYVAWAKQVVEMGGSVSAEHGIGKAKIPLLEVMFGVEGIDAMREIKRLFDPKWRFNPGNLFCKDEWG